MEEQNIIKNTLDQIPQANTNAKQIVGLVKKGGRITGYQLSDNSIVEKQQAVDMAKQGQIAGVGIAHRGDTEYLRKTIITTLLFFFLGCNLFFTSSIIFTRLLHICLIQIVVSVVKPAIALIVILTGCQYYKLVR